MTQDNWTTLLVWAVGFISGYFGCAITSQTGGYSGMIKGWFKRTKK